MVCHRDNSNSSCDSDDLAESQSAEPSQSVLSEPGPGPSDSNLKSESPGKSLRRGDTDSVTNDSNEPSLSH